MLQKEKPCIKRRGVNIFEFEDQGKFNFNLSSGKQVSSVASEGQY